MFISKRVLIISGIAFMLALGVAGFLLAFALSQAHSASTSATASATPPLVASDTTGATGNTIPHVTGTIQSLGNSSFVLSMNSGKRTVTVTVNNQTTYSKRKKVQSSFTSFSDLQVGERVQVDVQGTFSKQDSTVVAQKIILLPTTLATPTPTNG